MEFLLHYCGRLVLLLMVDVEANGDVGVQPEPLLQHFPDPEDRLMVGGVREPHCDLVSPLTDIDHGAIDLRRCL